MARSTRYGAQLDAIVMRGRRLTASLRALQAAAGPDAGGRTWYRIENKADAGPATVHIYDEIGFWGISADAFLEELAEVGTRDLVLRLNSPGGEVFDGVAIFNALQRHPGRITGHVDGLAASAASFVAMAADELIVEPGGQMMIHDAQGMCWGNAADARALADMLDRTSHTIAMIYAERAGGTAEEWRERMRAETWYDGPQAVEAKLADRVGESRARGRAEESAPDGGEPDKSKVANYYGENPGERDEDGRFKGGMPDVVATYVADVSRGALSIEATPDDSNTTVWSDGANRVRLSAAESGKLVNALRNEYATGDTTVTRRSGDRMVVVARVRGVGAGENEDGEPVALGKRLDLGEVADEDDYDERPGVELTSRQSEKVEQTAALAEGGRRSDTGYGPLDSFPSPDGKSIMFRMKGDDGKPVEVAFSRAEWRKIDRAQNLLWDGYDDTEAGDDDDPLINRLVVKTKAGPVAVEVKGRPADLTASSPNTDWTEHADARMSIMPEYDAPWSIVVDAEHWRVFSEIGWAAEGLGWQDATTHKLVMTLPAGARWRPVAVVELPWTYYGEQPGERDEDGRFRGGGSDVGFFPLDEYQRAYSVHDERSTATGLVAVVMSSGEYQLALDDPDRPEGRTVFADLEEAGLREFVTALRNARRGGEGEEFLVGGEDDPWAAFISTGDGGATLSITAGGGEGVEHEFGLDEDDIWDLDQAIIDIMSVDTPEAEDAWRGSAVWAAAPARTAAVSSTINDHPPVHDDALHDLTEAWA